MEIFRQKLNSHAWKIFKNRFGERKEKRREKLLEQIEELFNGIDKKLEECEREDKPDPFLKIDIYKA